MVNPLGVYVFKKNNPFNFVEINADFLVSFNFFFVALDNLFNYSIKNFIIIPFFKSRFVFPLSAGRFFRKKVNFSPKNFAGNKKPLIFAPAKRT